MTEASESDLRALASAIIAQTAGYVSMCWTPRPSEQVFDSTQASAAVDRALDELFTTFNISLKES